VPTLIECGGLEQRRFGRALTRESPPTRLRRECCSSNHGGSCLSSTTESPRRSVFSALAAGDTSTELPRPPNTTESCGTIIVFVAGHLLENSIESNLRFQHGIRLIFLSDSVCNCPRKYESQAVPLYIHLLQCLINLSNRSQTPRQGTSATGSDTQLIVESDLEVEHSSTHTWGVRRYRPYSSCIRLRRYCTSPICHQADADPFVLPWQSAADTQKGSDKVDTALSSQRHEQGLSDSRTLRFRCPPLPLAVEIGPLLEPCSWHPETARHVHITTVLDHFG